MDVVDNNDFLFLYLVFNMYLVVVDNKQYLFKTRFTFYMDVVDNNDFLFMYLVVENNIDFTWMLWIIMTSNIFHVFGF